MVKVGEAAAVAGDGEIAATLGQLYRDLRWGSYGAGTAPYANARRDHEGQIWRCHLSPDEVQMERAQRRVDLRSVARG